MRSDKFLPHHVNGNYTTLNESNMEEHEYVRLKLPAGAKVLMGQAANGTVSTTSTCHVPSTFFAHAVDHITADHVTTYKVDVDPPRVGETESANVLAMEKKWSEDRQHFSKTYKVPEAPQYPPEKFAVPWVFRNRHISLKTWSNYKSRGLPKLDR